MRTPLKSQHDGWDEFVQREIERFLQRYQALEIETRTSHGTSIVRVHVPYMLGTVAWVEQPETLARQRPRHQARLQRVAQAREQAPAELKAFFQRWFYEPSGKERLVACARSGPEDIRQLLQAAVEAGLLHAETDDLGSDALRTWLQRYGIGVDCSGFVQHALSHLLSASYDATGIKPASPQEVEVGWMRSPTVTNTLLENVEPRRFDLVATPALARPGDILVSPQHARIIVDTQVAEDQALIVTLAESTSRTDLVGEAGFLHDVGPRLYQVRYLTPGRPVRDQLPEHKRISEAAFEFEPSEWERPFLIARNRQLAAFHHQHEAPIAASSTWAGLQTKPPPSSQGEDH